MKNLLFTALILASSSSLLTTVSALSNGVGLTPSMGWSSWNLFACNINETLIMQMADALVDSGLSKLGYSYINIDDCWQSSRDTHGNILADPSTFPSGMKALSDYIHSKGLKFGVYSSAGSKTCEERPGSLGYEIKDANSYASWGVDYFKYDNCFEEGLSDWKGTVYRYSQMRDALNQTGRPIVYSLCNWGFVKPWEFGADMANSWRTTSDIWYLNNQPDGKLIIYISDSFEGWWCSAMSILDLNVDLTRFSGPGGFNDLDMLEVGNGGMTLAEYRTHFSAWAALKSPLILGNDLRSMTDEVKSIAGNAKVIAINQDPLGKSAVLMERRQGLDVWAGELSYGRRVLLVINRGKQEVKDIKVGFEVFGGVEGQTIEIKDLWEVDDSVVRRLSGTNVVKITSIASHDCKMYLISSPSSSDDSISFKSIVWPPTGTFPVITWWWPLVMYIRWYKTMTPSEVDTFHRQAMIIVVGGLMTMISFIIVINRTKATTTTGSGKEKKELKIN